MARKGVVINLSLTAKIARERYERGDLLKQCHRGYDKAVGYVSLALVCSGRSLRKLGGLCGWIFFVRLVRVRDSPRHTPWPHLSVDKLDEFAFLLAQVFGRKPAFPEALLV